MACSVPARQAPLCFVEVDPPSGSPAFTAGLKGGDAILAFGAALSFSEMPSQLFENVPVKLVVMGPDGHVESRVLLPRIFDTNRPTSLLGCQITDQCPQAFLPHPALEAPSEASPAAQKAATSEPPADAPTRPGGMVSTPAADKTPVGWQSLATPQGLRMGSLPPVLRPRAAGEIKPVDTTSISNAPRGKDELAAMFPSWRQQPNTLERDWQEDRQLCELALYPGDNSPGQAGGSATTSEYGDYYSAMMCSWPNRSDVGLSLVGTAVPDGITVVEPPPGYYDPRYAEYEQSRFREQRYPEYEQQRGRCAQYEQQQQRGRCSPYEQQRGRCSPYEQQRGRCSPGHEYDDQYSNQEPNYCEPPHSARQGFEHARSRPRRAAESSRSRLHAVSEGMASGQLVQKRPLQPCAEESDIESAEEEKEDGKPIRPPTPSPPNYMCRRVLASASVRAACTNYPPTHLPLFLFAPFSGVYSSSRRS